MPTSNNNCGQCNKLIRSDIRIIKCDTCDYYFHVKCCGINHKTFKPSDAREEIGFAKDVFIQTNSVHGLLCTTSRSRDM